MGSIKGFKCNCVNPIMYSVGWMYSTKQIHLLLIMKAPPLSSKIWQKIAECLLRYGSTDGLYVSSLIIHFCYSHGTEVHFVSFLSGGFITAIVVNSLERKLTHLCAVHRGATC